MGGQPERGAERGRRERNKEKDREMEREHCSRMTLTYKNRALYSRNCYAAQKAARLAKKKKKREEKKKSLSTKYNP